MFLVYVIVIYSHACEFLYDTIVYKVLGINLLAVSITFLKWPSAAGFYRYGWAILFVKSKLEETIVDVVT